MINVRTCQGCGGSGCTSEWCQRNVCACPDPRDIRYSVNHRPPRCLACLGSGQITDRIGAEDALADAETLGLSVLEASLLSRALTMLHKRTGELAAVIYAVAAARAAFRAVPGLKG